MKLRSKTSWLTLGDRKLSKLQWKIGSDLQDLSRLTSLKRLFAECELSPRWFAPDWNPPFGFDEEVGIHQLQKIRKILRK